MEKQQIIDQLSDIFAEVLKHPGIRLEPHTTANDIDEWDSLNNMTIISEVEKHWAFKFKLHDIIKMRNIGDMVDIIAKRSK